MKQRDMLNNRLPSRGAYPELVEGLLAMTGFFITIKGFRSSINHRA
jgi:hypothetical protein